MLQRYAKPALFLLLFAAAAAAALYTDRGGSLLDSAFHMGRFADWSRDMPLVSSLMLLGLSLPALIFLAVPDAEAVVVMVATMGYWPGFLLASLVLTLAGGVVCALTKSLTHNVIRRWMAVRRATGRVYLHRSTLAAEYCLLIAAVLCLCSLPAVLVGMVLGLCGMRAKAFCIAAFPWLASRAAMAGLGVVSVSGFELALLCLLGTVAVMGYVIWICDLLRRRVRADRLAGPVSVRVPARSGRQPAAMESIQVERLERAPGSDAAAGDSLALNDVLLVCVREEDERDTAALIVEEARAMGARVVACRLNAAAAPAGGQVSGFADRPEVVDLDEIFLRGFEEGAGRVLAVRAVTPMLRREEFRTACDALKSGCGLVYGTCAGENCLIGLSGKGRGRAWEPGMLAGRDFACDIAFILAGLAPHPRRLPDLPPSETMRPWLTVFVLAEGGATDLRATLNTCLRRPWTECVVLTDSLSGPAAAEADRQGVRCLLLEAEAADGLNRAVTAAQGRCLLFVRAGVELPVNYDQAVWFTLRQDRCRAGGFSLPLDIPSLRRAVRWLGTAVHPGAFSGPGLEQGVFLTRKDYDTFGGLTGPDIAKALAVLVERAGQSGRVILHNARVRFAQPPEATAAGTGTLKTASIGGAAGAGSLLAQMRGLFSGRDKGAEKGDREAELARLTAEAEAMTASCDHCGRCTHVSPTLHKYQLDLSELIRHPLLAWHCFMSGVSTGACHRGIDAAALVRLLRTIHVTSHGGRLSRPGHGRTLALARCVPVYARRVREGVNLLLEPDFCCTYPRTAVEIARRLWQAGMGVLVADSGARLADLGMERQAKAIAERLRRLAVDKGVTQLLTLSPATHCWLVAMNVPCEPVLSQAEALRAQPLSMQGRRLLVACSDRGRKTFVRALAPWLRGEAREIDVPCCGAGGEAAVLEPQLAARLKAAVRDAARGDRVLTSCAGCARALTGAGVAADLDVSVLIGVNEAAVTGPAQIRALVTCLSRLSALNGTQESMPAMPLDLSDGSAAPEGEARGQAATAAAAAALVADDAAEEAAAADVADQADSGSGGSEEGGTAGAAADATDGAPVDVADTTSADADDGVTARGADAVSAAAAEEQDAVAVEGASADAAGGETAEADSAAPADTADEGAAGAADGARAADEETAGEDEAGAGAADSMPVEPADTVETAAAGTEAAAESTTPAADGGPGMGAADVDPAQVDAAAGAHQPDGPAEGTGSDALTTLSLGDDAAEPAAAGSVREKQGGGFLGRILSRVTGAGRQEEGSMPVLDFTEQRRETGASAPAPGAETAPAAPAPDAVEDERVMVTEARDPVPAASEQAGREGEWVVTDLSVLGLAPAAPGSAQGADAQEAEPAAPDSPQPAPQRHARAVSLKDYR